MLYIGVTKDFEGILATGIIIHNLLRFSLNICKVSTKIGHEVSYKCTKFERNWSIRRLLLVGSKLVFWNSAKKKKNVKKFGQFSGINFSWTTDWIFLKFGVYMEGIKYVIFYKLA